VAAIGFTPSSIVVAEDIRDSAARHCRSPS